MKNFDPNAASGDDTGIFGLPFSAKESSLVLLPVPWDVTTSYKKGTAMGPAAMLKASRQIDLYDADLGEFYEAGIAMLPISKKIQDMGELLRPKAEKIIKACGDVSGNAALKKALKEVDAGSKSVNTWVESEVKKWLKEGKIVGVVGGEHSTPFGAMKALLEKHPKLGVLQIDAHCDLRKAFESFEHSHASIMYNALTKLPLQTLVQVGIRDFCKEEKDMILAERKRIKTFFDTELAAWKSEGKTWKKIAKTIVSSLPQEVFISFDIDGLEPTLCPHTGTPVPGGLSFNDASYLIGEVVRSGRKIVGFDLNEVAPGGSTDWDSNVGARILFKLCGWTLRSQKKV